MIQDPKDAQFRLIELAYPIKAELWDMQHKVSDEIMAENLDNPPVFYVNYVDPQKGTVDMTPAVPMPEGFGDDRWAIDENGSYGYRVKIHDFVSSARVLFSKQEDE